MEKKLDDLLAALEDGAAGANVEEVREGKAKPAGDAEGAGKEP